MPDAGLLRAMKPRPPAPPADTPAAGAPADTPTSNKPRSDKPTSDKRKADQPTVGKPTADKSSTSRARKAAAGHDEAPRPAARHRARGAGVDDPQAAREADRYENPIASREAILQTLSDAEGPLDAEALQRTLGLEDPDRAEALDKRLAAMLRDGQVLKNRRGGFVPATMADLIPGTVIANPEGFGFLRPEGGVGDDLFLPPFEMRKVMHGDRVLGSVTGVDRRGRREGVIVEVLERRVTRLIGRFALEQGISFVVRMTAGSSATCRFHRTRARRPVMANWWSAKSPRRRTTTGRRSAACWRCWATS